MRAVGIALLVAGIVICVVISLPVGVVIAIVGLALLIFALRAPGAHVNSWMVDEEEEKRKRAIEESQPCDICRQPPGIHLKSCPKYDWSKAEKE